MKQHHCAHVNRFVVAALMAMLIVATRIRADEFRSVPLQQTIDDVQPMTGIVLWTTNEDSSMTPIQLEYTYMTYAQIVNGKGEYDWSRLEVSAADMGKALFSVQSRDRTESSETLL